MHINGALAPVALGVCALRESGSLAGSARRWKKPECHIFGLLPVITDESQRSQEL
ncbi:MAG TPA: hypothetical protein VGF67_08670 [Ktedonobacteraceae bacterium]